ncbi:uncharacterized protein LOC143039704 [Oratosquilla oratoria]|uniref:uncharacterized protein LOC143039704 n=1 Tax=Oratosquilla oratoria TaxID=337810 RepID=UPI003F7727A0
MSGRGSFLIRDILWGKDSSRSPTQQQQHHSSPSTDTTEGSLDLRTRPLNPLGVKAEDPLRGASPLGGGLRGLEGGEDAAMEGGDYFVLGPAPRESSPSSDTASLNDHLKTTSLLDSTFETPLERGAASAPPPPVALDDDDDDDEQEEDFVAAAAGGSELPLPPHPPPHPQGSPGRQHPFVRQHQLQQGFPTDGGGFPLSCGGRPLLPLAAAAAAAAGAFPRGVLGFQDPRCPTGYPALLPPPLHAHHHYLWAAQYSSLLSALPLQDYEVTSPSGGAPRSSPTTSPPVPVPLPVYVRTRPSAVPDTSTKKCRRSRTVFTEMQLVGLERRFEAQKYLSTPDRVDLAKSLGLSQLQVKTWYQNRRMKWKKQVMQEGSKEPPTKPKGRPKKNSVPTFAELQRQKAEEQRNLLVAGASGEPSSLLQGPPPGEGPHTPEEQKNLVVLQTLDHARAERKAEEDEDEEEEEEEEEGGGGGGTSETCDLSFVNLHIPWTYPSGRDLDQNPATSAGPKEAVVGAAGGGAPETPGRGVSLAPTGAPVLEPPCEDEDSVDYVDVETREDEDDYLSEYRNLCLLDMKK